MVEVDVRGGNEGVGDGRGGVEKGVKKDGRWVDEGRKGIWR